jgi:uncharacterized protein (TIGR02271 family)
MAKDRIVNVTGNGRRKHDADRPRASSKSVEKARSEKIVVPVVAEELAVGKREVESGRVRITRLVREEQKTVDQPLFADEVVVERVPVNRIVDAPPEVRHEGETMIVPVVEEVLVVEKKLMLREEVRVMKRRNETHRPQTVTIRKQDVQVERIAGSGNHDGTALANDAAANRRQGRKGTRP